MLWFYNSLGKWVCFFPEGSLIIVKTFLNVTLVLYYVGNQGGLYIALRCRVSLLFPEVRTLKQCFFFFFSSVAGVQFSHSVHSAADPNLD